MGAHQVIATGYTIERGGAQGLMGREAPGGLTRQVARETRRRPRRVGQTGSTVDWPVDPAGSRRNRRTSNQAAERVVIGRGGQLPGVTGPSPRLGHSGWPKEAKRHLLGYRCILQGQGTDGRKRGEGGAPALPTRTSWVAHRQADNQGKRHFLFVKPLHKMLR